MKLKKIDMLIDEKNSKNRIILLMTSIIFFIVIIVIIITKIFILNPKNVFLYSLNNSYHNLKNIINIENNIDLSKYQTIISNTNLNFYFEAKNNALNELISNNNVNNLNINLKNDIDIKNNIYNSNIELLNNEGNVSLNMYKDDNCLYILLNNIYEEYLKFPLKSNYNISNINLINSDEIKMFFNTFKELSLKKIKEKNFKISKEKILLNDEVIKANKISYQISSNELNLMINETLDKCYNINNDLKKIIVNLNKYLEDNKYSFILNTYTYGFIPETLKYSLEIIDDSNKYIVEYSDYSNIFSISFDSNNENNLKININNYGKNEYNINAQYNKYKIDFNISLNNNDIIFNYKIEYLDSLLSGKTKIYDINLVNNNDYFKIKSNNTYKKYDEYILTVNINGNSDNTINENIEWNDINNSINIYNLNNKELSIIINNLLSNELINKIYNIYLEYKLRYD